jgi:hypothetical protein
MSASMLIYRICIKDMIREQTQDQSPVQAKQILMVKSDEDCGFKSCSCKLQFSRIFLLKVRAEEKESKNLFGVIRAEEKESPLITAVAVAVRREEEKKKKERSGGII